MILEGFLRHCPVSHPTGAVCSVLSVLRCPFCFPRALIPASSLHLVPRGLPGCCHHCSKSHAFIAGFSSAQLLSDRIALILRKTLLLPSRQSQEIWLLLQTGGKVISASPGPRLAPLVLSHFLKQGEFFPSVLAELAPPPLSLLAFFVLFCFWLYKRKIREQAFLDTVSLLRPVLK